MKATLDIRGEVVELLPERAVWRQRERTLFVADLHLGKATAFRVFGSPAPTGVSEETLRRLGALVDALTPERLVVLGDFVHASPSMTEGLAGAIRAWRAERSALECALVLGNHDARAGAWLSGLGFAVSERAMTYAACECRHFPLSEDDALSDGPITLAGHLHPMTRLRGPGRDSLRLPCFVICGRQVVLPAFGEFTGGAFVPRQPGVRLMAATEFGVFEAG